MLAICHHTLHMLSRLMNTVVLPASHYDFHWYKYERTREGKEYVQGHRAVSHRADSQTQVFSVTK